MIEEAAILRSKVLKIPLLTLIQAGDAAVDFQDKMANRWAQPWLDLSDQAIEPVFFDHLFARAEQGRAADQAWARFLKTIAKRIFERAAWLPCRSPARGGSRRSRSPRRSFGGLFWASFKGYLVAPAEEAADVG